MNLLDWKTKHFLSFLKLSFLNDCKATRFRVHYVIEIKLEEIEDKICNWNNYVFWYDIVYSDTTNLIWCSFTKVYW